MLVNIFFVYVLHVKNISLFYDVVIFQPGKLNSLTNYAHENSKTPCYHFICRLFIW